MGCSASVIPTDFIIPKSESDIIEWLNKNNINPIIGIVNNKNRKFIHFYKIIFEINESCVLEELNLESESVLYKLEIITREHYNYENNNKLTKDSHISFLLTDILLEKICIMLPNIIPTMFCIRGDKRDIRICFAPNIYKNKILYRNHYDNIHYDNIYFCQYTSDIKKYWNRFYDISKINYTIDDLNQFTWLPIDYTVRENYIKNYNYTVSQKVEKMKLLRNTYNKNEKKMKKIIRRQKCIKLKQERLEQERLEQERLEQERLEQKRLEQKRLEKDIICSICQEYISIYEKRNIITKCCNNIFHENCISEAKKYNIKCPLCRS